ncbi:MAG: 4Fe-4S binding protein [Desulfobacteraceae bacterium]|nr:4Fe-4S binding protein [Desulfobacteraceae bacterium]
MKSVRKIIEIDEELCDGCGQCVTSCAEGAIRIVDGKARLISENYCDGLGACLGECPQGALKIVERTAKDFDPEAVEEHLKASEGQKAAEHEKMPCGCPAANIRTFKVITGDAGKPAGESGPSTLSHWPVQIRLVPATAPFLKGADLLVAADCAPVAYPSLHRDFLEGRVILLGCPKFDDGQAYIAKFAEIFQKAGIRSVTVLDMEVPCCSALPAMVKKGLEVSGKDVPLEEVTIGLQGNILRRRKLAA